MDEEKLQLLLEDLPRSPGVYLMKDAREKIVYVGKAKNLSSRVRSYFTSSTSDTRFFRRNIRNIVADIDIVLTSSEKEALLLENSLIKLHSPRFNIKLKDDKDYLCIRLDMQHEWPKLEVVRRPKKDGALYFGPYHSASRARETLKLVHQHFRIRSCKDGFMANRVRPCLQNQMHRCPGPCVLDVDREEYLKQIHFARLFLLGKREELLADLRQSMGRAAENFEYELAAILRDQIQAVLTTLAPQQVVTPHGIDQDVIGLARQGDQVEIVILQVREGCLRSRLDFYFSDQEFPEEEILSSFILQYYKTPERIPREILLSKPAESIDALAELLSEKQGAKVNVISPRRGAKTSQTAMADLNAKQLLETRLKDTDVVAERLAGVQRRLRLSRLPRRIECVDISHSAGKNTVGAISVVVDCQVRRALGRTYRIRSAEAGDDYGAIRELLTRRFSRAAKGEPGWEAPDLLVIDGGRGQLGVARTVLSDLSIENQHVVAIAKEKGEGDSAKSDRVFIPGRMNPIPLKARVSPLYVLAMARDEAHRLANVYRKKLVSKGTSRSELDEIKGLGPKVKTNLLKHFGSVKRIRQASREELLSVSGVGPQMVQKILEMGN